MILIHLNKRYGLNFTYSFIKSTLTSKTSPARYVHRKAFALNENINSSLRTLIEKYESKLLYSSVIEENRLRYGYHKNKAIMGKMISKQKKEDRKTSIEQPIPLSLKYLIQDNDLEDILRKNSQQQDHDDTNANETVAPTPSQFPFENDMDRIISPNITGDDIESDKTENEENVLENIDDPSIVAEREVRLRSDMEEKRNWMTAYDNYDDGLTEDDLDYSDDNYGTADPACPTSNVPCGGCGALLHCKDTRIPGYIPSEIFKNHSKAGGASLSSITCQRCYFLSVHNVALQVQVSPDFYPQVLHTISERRALVVLMVDLLDFPCSIWPGIADIFGRRTPIVLVGNKVDLLPQDDRKYLGRVKKTLLETAKEYGFAMCDLRHVELISAKTGFGVENLITHLHAIWKYRGDVYLVGCTNVGKSSLFNALLQSDYCKSKASDLIQRATCSVWPGTTLNLLKFPILRPSGWRVYERHQRLVKESHTLKLEREVRKQRFRDTRSTKYLHLVGRIGRTFPPERDYVDGQQDSFQVRGTASATGRLELGINEDSSEYALGRWCYDTPGVVQLDQLLHLLTTEELVLTIPRQVIRPRTFCVKPGTTLFIAGLARLDYVDGPNSLRLTVFSSNELPITLCKLEEADRYYDELLGSEMFKVPVKDPERLKKWPGLELAKVFTVTGLQYNESCNDVVLSNAGWVAVTGGYEMEYKLQAWTPEKRGAYVRNSLLSKSVTLRGARIRDSPAYRMNKMYIP